MELSDHLRAIRKRWWITLLALAVTMGLAAVLTSRTTPVYESSLTFYVSVATETGNALQADELAQRRINSYVGVMTSERLAERVVEATDWDLAPREVLQMISASPGSSTVLLSATVRDTRPGRSLDVAEAIADVFGPLITELEGPASGATVNLSVISGPTLRNDPVSPRPGLNLAIGALAGLALGFAGSIARERADRSLRNREQVLEHTGLPVLAEVPRAPRGGRPLLSDLAAGAPPAEAYRRLRTNLTFAGVEQPVRTLVVSSALPTEGKSTTALNLALALAETGARTLLVDADLRRPALAGLLDLEGTAGLTNVLAGQAALGDVVQTVASSDLDVLASGTVPPNPSEMLGSTAMRHLMDAARSAYDFVIVDTPPLLPVTDAAVVSRHVDGVVVVARHGRTKREDLVAAAETLRTVGARLLGVVLNFVPRKSDRSAYHAYPARPGHSVGRRAGRTGRRTTAPTPPGPAPTASGSAAEPGARSGGAKPSQDDLRAATVGERTNSSKSGADDAAARPPRSLPVGVRGQRGDDGPPSGLHPRADA